VVEHGVDRDKVVGVAGFHDVLEGFWFVRVENAGEEEVLDGGALGTENVLD
jgi:hypothetical protein